MKEKAWLAYSDATPYLSDIQWTKMSITKTIEASRDLIEFKEKIRQLEEQEKESARRSDLRIYLIYLEKATQK